MHMQEVPHFFFKWVIPGLFSLFPYILEVLDTSIR